MNYKFRVTAERYIETFNLGWVHEESKCFTEQEAKAIVCEFLKLEFIRNIKIEVL